MFQLTENKPPVDVQESEYLRLLGYPKNHVPAGRPGELASAARRWFSENGRPWIYAREIGALELRDEKLRLAGIEFSSRQLHDSIAGAQAHSIVLVAVSAGKECEEYARQLWSEAKPDEYFFMEMFGSAVVEQLVAVASGRICGWADANAMVALPHYSPGYSGWDIADQVTLWNLFRQNQSGGFPGELDVLETGMLRPKKSLLAVVGVTRNLEKARRFAKLIPCENCSLPGCQYRRAPYLHALPQLEDIHQLQHSRYDDELAGPKNSALARNAKYSVNVRALQKWSQERLRLKFLPDGSVEAHFRYEGTTCSNMGRLLEFDYCVKLGTADDHYKIIETSCAPSPDDSGHAQQCEYLNNAGSLMRSIATEKPLLGRPLNDVLAWTRMPNPSGCFCDLERREHKWGLVFEVIHFALAQREKGITAKSNLQVRFSM
jgi:hypothetical protein